MDEEVPLCAASIWYPPTPPSRSPPQLMILHKLKICSPETSHHITSIITCPSRCILRWNSVKTVPLRSPPHHRVAHKMDFRPSNGILITGQKISGCCTTPVVVLNWTEWTSAVARGNHFYSILMLYVQKAERKNKAHVCQPPIYPEKHLSWLLSPACLHACYCSWGLESINGMSSHLPLQCTTWSQRHPDPL